MAWRGALVAETGPLKCYDWSTARYWSMTNMEKSTTATVDEYLAELPADRRSTRATVEAVRAVILEHLPDGYEETMQYGMIGYP
mgnify:CR=1 FL=1